MKNLSAAQQRFLDQAVLIAAMELVFTKLERSNLSIYPLGEIANTTSGGTPDRRTMNYYGGNIPWIKSGELNDGMIESSEEYLTEEGLQNSSAKIYPKGTLVVALYGATVGKTGILAINAASNQAVCAIMPKTNIVSRDYLFWFLRFKRPAFLKHSFGGAQPNISQKVLKETNLPVPSSELQKEIVQFLDVIERRQQADMNLTIPDLPTPLSGIKHTIARIEELAAKVEEARGLRRETVVEIDATLDSAVGLAFEKLEPTEYKLLSTVTSKIGSGSTPSGGRASYPDSGIPFIRSLNVRMREFLWEGIAYIDQATHNSMKGTHIKKNDVLLNITGASIGRVACVPEELNEANVNQHVAIIRPIETLDSRYLMYWLSQPTVQDFINNEQKGATRQGFTKAQIGSFNIPLLPLPEQRRIVAYLDDLQARVDAVRQLQAETRAELDGLLPSILDQAFRGELV